MELKRSTVVNIQGTRSLLILPYGIETGETQKGGQVMNAFNRTLWN